MLLSILTAAYPACIISTQSAIQSLDTKEYRIPLEPYHKQSVLIIQLSDYFHNFIG